MTYPGGGRVSGTYHPPAPERVRPQPPPDAAARALWQDPRYFPPRGHIRFLTQGRVSLGPGPATAVLATFQVSGKSLGILRTVTFQINDTSAATDVQFMVRQNGAALPGLTLEFFPRLAAHVTVSFSPEVTAEDIPMGATLDVLVTVRDAATYLVGASLEGWTYSEDLRRAVPLLG